MLNGDGNEICEIINSLISDKISTFLCRCFAWPQRETF